MKALLRKHATKVRFGLVGAANTALDFGLLLVLANFFAVPHVIANIISSSIAFVASFFANKKYTFKTTGQSVVREMILFTVITLFGLWVIQSAIITLLTPPIQAIVTNDTITLVIAKLVATLASLTWNYILYSRIVFKTSH
jgi:putative flippase GtrA